MSIQAMAFIQIAGTTFVKAALLGPDGGIAKKPIPLNLSARN
jgi:hypothetical protein